MSRCMHASVYMGKICTVLIISRCVHKSRRAVGESSGDMKRWRG